MFFICLCFFWFKFYILRCILFLVNIIRLNLKWIIIIDFLCSCVFFNWVIIVEIIVVFVLKLLFVFYYLVLKDVCLFNCIFCFCRLSVIVMLEKNLKKILIFKLLFLIVILLSKIIFFRFVFKLKFLFKLKDSEVMDFCDNLEFMKECFFLDYWIFFRGFLFLSDVVCLI